MGTMSPGATGISSSGDHTLRTGPPGPSPEVLSHLQSVGDCGRELWQLQLLCCQHHMLVQLRHGGSWPANMRTGATISSGLVVVVKKTLCVLMEPSQS